LTSRGHIASHCPQRALVIVEDDSLLENDDDLLVMDLLEPDYDGTFL